MKFTSVDAYLSRAPEPHRSTLIEPRSTLREILPQAERGDLLQHASLQVEGKAVAGYAYFRNHCIYFPHSGSVLPQLSEDLAGYRWSKGTLRSPIDRSLPRALVRRLVEVRLEQLGL